MYQSVLVGSFVCVFIPYLITTIPPLLNLIPPLSHPYTYSNSAFIYYFLSRVAYPNSSIYICRNRISPLFTLSHPSHPYSPLSHLDIFRQKNNFTLIHPYPTHIHIYSTLFTLTHPYPTHP